MRKISLPILALVIGSSAFAQEKKDSTALKIIEGVRIESKRFMNKSSDQVAKVPLKNIENPQVYTSIPKGILDKQLAYSVEDAMKNVGGVTKLWDATNRPDGGSYFVSRGFSTSIKSRNGMMSVMNTNADLVNLDRLEFIKGPSATLFGNVITSYGGFINRVTKKPSKKFGGEASVTFGQYNLFRGAVDVNTPLDKKKKVAFRLNASYQTQDSWQEAGFFNSLNFMPSISFKPNKRLSMQLDAEVVHSKGNSSGGHSVFFLEPSTYNAQISSHLLKNGLTETQVNYIMQNAPKTFSEAYGSNNVKDFNIDYNRSYLSDDLYSTNKSTGLFFNADYKISDHWKSQTLAAYNKLNMDGNMVFQFLLPNYLGNFITSLQQGNINFGEPGADFFSRQVWRAEGTAENYQIQQNFVSDYSFGKLRNRAVIGFDYSKVNSEVLYGSFMGSLYGIPFPRHFDLIPTQGVDEDYTNLTLENVKEAYKGSSYDIGQYSENSSLGGYINNVLNIGEHAIVSAGLRVDRFKTAGDYDYTTKSYFNPYDQVKLSPKFGLIVMPFKNKLSVFANYQNSFKNKGGNDKSGKSFIPEQANQFEVGLKYSLLKDKIAGSVSYYNIKVENYLRVDNKNPNFKIQQGTRKSKGVEFELFANPVQGWNMMFGYGYNDSVLEDVHPSEDRLRPIGSGPQNTFNFWSNYTFTDTFLKGFGLGLQINYSGEVIAMNANPDGKIIVPSYTILGSSFYYDQPKYRISLKINNLTDQKYWMGWTNMIPQMPRQIVGGVTYKF